jgi:hypothetical protein
MTNTPALEAASEIEGDVLKATSVGVVGLTDELYASCRWSYRKVSASYLIEEDDIESGADSAGHGSVSVFQHIPR